MNAESFCYWLKGTFELGRVEELDKVQVQIIQDHLDLVFKKETPIRNRFFEDHQLKYKGVELGPFPSSPLLATC